MDSSSKPEKQNPRQLANIFSHLSFAWCVPLLYHGMRNGLNTGDLTKCLKEDYSETLGDKLEANWLIEVEARQSKSKAPRLWKAVLKTFWRSSMIDGFICLVYIIIKSLIPAVLAQLLLQFQRPISPSLNIDNINSTSIDDIITRSSRSVGNSTPAENMFDGDGKLAKNRTLTETTAIDGLNSAFADLWVNEYGLGAVLVLSTVLGCFLFHHVDLRQTLLGARMRIACCSLIYRKTLQMSMKAAGQTPAGYLINLISNDVNRLDFGVLLVHWIWILPIQAVLICFLIWQEIGWAALVGVVGMLLKTVPVHTGLSKLASKLRMKIAHCTDARVGIMNELVQGIQVIKMYAWEKPFQGVVAEARRLEIKQIRYASYLRGFFLSTMVFTERSTLYITIAATVLLGNQVSAHIVFSAAAYYNMLQLVAAIWYPAAVSFGAEALVSLRRIQEFLLLENQNEDLKGFEHNQQGNEASNQVILLRDVNAAWNEEQENVQITLKDVNLQIKKGQLCAIIGPVGAGKSSLLQLLLGELSIGSGKVVINGELSYASQEPWLFTGTVRSNILCGESFEQKRYRDVTKCCALSTDFRQLAHGDRTVVGDRGSSLSGGQRARVSLARAVYKPANIYLLDDPLSAVDAHVGRHLFDEVIGPKGRLANEKATRILVTHQVHFLREADWIVILENGSVLRQGTYHDLINSELDFAKLLEPPKHEHEQSSESKSESSSISTEMATAEEDDIPYIDGVKDGYQPLSRNSSGAESLKFKLSSEQDVVIDDENPENQAEGGVAARIWWEYFRAGSGLMGLSFMVFIMLLSQVICSGSDYFVNIWTQQEYLRSLNEPTALTTRECLYIYGALIIGVVIVTIFRGYLFFKVCMHASKVLHDRMFGCVLHATMRFFDTNPSGRILNRFSKDMGAVDEYLPRALIDCIQISLVMFGILIVIIVVNPILLIAICVAAILDCLILKLFLRSSQDLKRLEGICRSPVFSHLSSSLSGLATIRARGLQNVVAKEFDGLQNVHSGVWQLTMATKTALGLWLDCVSCCFLTSVTFSFIMLSKQTFSGNVGLAISQAMILTGMVQYGVRQAAESLQQMTSVERVLQYTELEQEPVIEKQPPESWPTHGYVEFRDMSCRYDEKGPAVLKNLNIVIEPGWKIGIVGRTGAGKSSLIGALFRLANIEGDILIDGIDTGEISLETLRSKISIIPQDPVLFSASVRYNLDPFDKFSDAEIWRALEEVELKSAIQGLDFMVTERGNNFSVGQRQLMCLARAILRNNKVLVLDEATANVDPQTDALIQHTIRTKFKQYTVLTVAHRLHTVMDSDRILVMDAGRVREYDIPYLLLKKPKGALRQMVEATGGEAETLKKTAHDMYKKLQRANDAVP